MRIRVKPKDIYSPWDCPSSMGDSTKRHLFPMGLSLRPTLLYTVPVPPFYVSAVLENASNAVVVKEPNDLTYFMQLQLLTDSDLSRITLDGPPSPVPPTLPLPRPFPFTPPRPHFPLLSLPIQSPLPPLSPVFLNSS